MFEHSLYSQGKAQCGHSIEFAVMDYTRATVICTFCGEELNGMESSFYGNTMNDYTRICYSDETSWKHYEKKTPIQSFSTKNTIDNSNAEVVKIPKIKLSSLEKRKIETFDHIDTIVNILGLNDSAMQSAKMFYERIESTNCKKCKKVSLLAAVCVSLVIKTRRINLSFKELSAASTVRAKEIMKLNHVYSKLLSLKKHYVSLSDTISKYASAFRLDYHQEKFAFELSEFIQKNEIIPGNNPFSCISVIVFFTCLLIVPSKDKHIKRHRKALNWKQKMSKHQRPQEEMIKTIASKLDISINTIKKSLGVFKEKSNLFFVETILKKYNIKQIDIDLLLINI